MQLRTWYPENYGIVGKVDEPFPTNYDIVSVDVETDTRDNSVLCVGVCGEPGVAYCYFDFKAMLPLLKGKKLIMHNGKSDIGWLEQFGFSMADLYWDSMLAEYVIDSSKKRYALKVLAKEHFNYDWPSYQKLTTDKEIIQECCEADKSLYRTRTKTTKRKGEQVSYLLPRSLSLGQMTRGVVANYNHMDCVATFRLYQSQQKRATKQAIEYMNKLEFPTQKLIFEMEKLGIGVSLEKTLKTHKEFRKKARDAKRSFAKSLPGVLITSPSQVKEGLRRCGIVVASTGEDEIKAFKGNPVVDSLLEFRGAFKVASTYTKPIWKAATASIDGRIHPRFNQTGTITGRLSSSDPINAQNQPLEAKHCFEAKAGHLLVVPDFSQLELRIPAHFSGDKLLCEAFNNPTKKLHQVTADAVNRSYFIGKQINFIIPNGGGASRLAAVADLPMDEAEAIIETYWRQFAGYKAWREAQTYLAHKNGYMTTLFGRVTKVPDINHHSKWIRAEAERTAISIKVQGSGGEIGKVAMLKTWKKWGYVPLVNEHDSGVYEIPEGEIEVASQRIKECYESCVQLKVPLVVEIKVGKTWGECKI